MANNDKGRLPPFVALLKETLASSAWQALSHGARSLYVCLKARYSSNLHNNGRLYVSQRIASQEIGSHTNQIARWFRELQHYGFIVQTRGGSLGVDGKGKAPHWRLTECGYLRDPPTRDFTRWDGTRFKEQLPRRKKQNPVLENKDTPSVNTRTPVSVISRTRIGTSVLENYDIQRHPTVLEKQDITSLTTPISPNGSRRSGDV